MKPWFRAAAGLLTLAAADCSRPSGERDAIVLSVGDREFTRADFDRFTESQLHLSGPPDAPLLSALFDEFVREQLLLIAADEAGIEIPENRLDEEIRVLNRNPVPEKTNSPETGASTRFREEVRDRLRVRRFLESVVLAGLEVTDEAIRFEYETSRALYSRPETVRLSERRFPDREAANAAVSSGEIESGGFLRIGAFRRGELPDPVDQAVFGIEAGEMTEVIETAAGFRVFRVDERLPAAALDLDEVEEVVRMTVLRREADTRVEAFIAGLERRWPIRVHAAQFDFPYVGLLEPPE